MSIKTKINHTKESLLPNFSKQEKNSNLPELGKLTKIELEEIKERQLKLLSNKSRMSLLPDKGKRIQDYLIKIDKELINRNDVEKAAEMFSVLNIASKGKKSTNSMEWYGKYNAEVADTVLDSDDEEEVDPLQVIAQNCNSSKIVKIIKPEQSLITESDLKEINSFNDDCPVMSDLVEISLNDKSKFQKIRDKTSETVPLPANNEFQVDPHVDYVCGIEYLGEAKHKYKPYFTTKTNVHDYEKEKFRKKSSNWEVTAATPPLYIHNEVKVLTLHDSIELQLKQTEVLKKIQAEQATNRLLKQSHREETNIDVSNAKASEFFRHYREVNDTSETDSDYEELTIASDDEVLDECDIPEKGTVNIGY